MIPHADEIEAIWRKTVASRNTYFAETGLDDTKPPCDGCGGARWGTRRTCYACTKARKDQK